MIAGPAAAPARARARKLLDQTKPNYLAAHSPHR